ncbi:MAG: hypothetical protein KF798_04495 [Candidatus Paracaedibacteraceae bacterium]|nr:hypothetical protein [Candidatus Paracaedibacteraceae bacterium]
MSIANALQLKISDKPNGAVFCANDFADLGSRGNIDVILHRLSQKGDIRRLGYGLYDKPNKSQLLGDLSPDIKDILDAYSRRMGQSFVLDPLNAANLVGFSTQVPARLMYLTDGNTHDISICGITLHFIHADPKKMAGAGTPVGIIIQALRYFGSNQISDTFLTTIINRLSKADMILLNGLKTRTTRNLVPIINRMMKIANIY